MPFTTQEHALLKLRESTEWAMCDARGRTVRRNRTRLSKPAALRYAGEDKKLNAELSRSVISFCPVTRSCRNMVAFLTCNTCLPSSHTRAVKKSGKPCFLRGCPRLQRSSQNANSVFNAGVGPAGKHFASLGWGGPKFEMIAPSPMSH